MAQASRARLEDERLQFATPVAASLPDLFSAQPASISAADVSVVTHERKRWQSLLPARLTRLKHGLYRAFITDLERGNGFLFAPIFMAAGAIFYFTMRQEPGFAPLLLCLGVSIGLALISSARPVLHIVFLAACMFSAGALAGKIETSWASTPMLGSQITTQVTGRVMRIEYQASGRVRLTLDIMATQRPTLRYAPDRVRATARSVPEGLKPGDTIRGLVRLMPPSGPVRPQSYDFTFNSYFSGIGASGFFMSGPEIIAEQTRLDVMTRIAVTAQMWRERMAGRIENSIGGPEGAVAAALITGVRAGIPEDVNEALRITGLYHIISISGLHMALVAGTLMVSLRAGFALFPTFAMRRPVKKYAAFLALLATGFYLIMSGSDVAAQRSFIMLAVMLLAVLFDRAALTMRNLAISALIILAIAPHEVIGPSFQMSFAATAALVAAYAAWRNRRDRRSARLRAGERPMVRGLRSVAAYTAGLSMTSVVAGLATALFTAWHFQQVSPLSLVANLAVMPIVSVVVMPMAVLASLIMPLGLDGPPLWLMGQGIAAMNNIAIWLADYSAFDATGAIPLAAVITLTMALVLLTMSETALRWAVFPLLVVGVGLLAQRQLPDAFVSEDGALVALSLADGRIAVNRSRPRAFTMDNWQRAFGGGEIVRPVKGDTGGEGAARNGDWLVPENVMQSALPVDTGFVCFPDLCVASRTDGAVIVHTKNAQMALPFCNHASLIVIVDTTAQTPCPGTETTVVTGRELARRGAIEVTFHRAESFLRADIRFAITEPFRPWHAHRRYSRAARGLAPYQRPDS